MTYCVGLLLNEGMVLLSDTRTNAGLDNVSTYRKMFVFEEPGERVVAIMTAGSLSTTQTTLAQLEEATEAPEPDPERSIMHAETMLGVARVVGRTLAETAAEIRDRMPQQGPPTSATMIVAGQRRGGAMRMFLIYPEGNFIEATDDTPYLQIGEHKYGKPILDRVVTPATTLEQGAKGRAPQHGLDAAVEPVGGHAARPGADREGRVEGRPAPPLPRPGRGFSPDEHSLVGGPARGFQRDRDLRRCRAVRRRDSPAPARNARRPTRGSDFGTPAAPSSVHGARPRSRRGGRRASVP